jgi:hypothetical protein
LIDLVPQIETASLGTLDVGLDSAGNGERDLPL